MSGKGIHSFDFEKDLLLFDEHTQKLILLNSTSKSVWEGLRAGITKDEIVRILAGAAPIDPEQVLSDVNSIISQWQDLGLLTTQYNKDERHNTVTIEQTEFIQLENHEKIIFPPRENLCCVFQVLGTVYRFNAPDKTILNLARRHLSYFLIEDPVRSDIEFALAKTATQYILHKNKKPVDFCPDINGIVPMLNAMVLMTTYDTSRCLIGLHAAAVIKDNVCVLLPAGSGSGKSTLTTALIHSGFTYGADDLVLLTATPGKVIPVPTPIGIKEGSWPVLEKYHPAIYSYPLHKRSDNRQIRYLSPYDELNPYSISTDPVHVKCIVYPDYKADNQLCLDRISPGQSICSMAAAGFDVHERLDKERIGQLVEWIKTTPSYRLSFNRLEDAIQCLESLWTKISIKAVKNL